MRRTLFGYSRAEILDPVRLISQQTLPTGSLRSASPRQVTLSHDVEQRSLCLITPPATSILRE